MNTRASPVELPVVIQLQEADGRTLIPQVAEHSDMEKWGRAALTECAAAGTGCREPTCSLR